MKRDVKSKQHSFDRSITLFIQGYGLKNCDGDCVFVDCYSCKIRAFRKFSKSFLPDDVVFRIVHFFLMVNDLHICIPEYLSVLAHPKINWSLSQFDYVYPGLMSVWNFTWAGFPNVLHDVVMIDRFILKYNKRKTILPNL